VPKLIADAIDRAVSIAMRFAADLPRAVIRPRYDAARAAPGGEPLVHLAARALLDQVRKRDVVLILAGSGSRDGRPKGVSNGLRAVVRGFRRR
jgi:hypothetical protein